MVIVGIIVATQVYNKTLFSVLLGSHIFTILKSARVMTTVATRSRKITLLPVYGCILIVLTIVVVKRKNITILHVLLCGSLLRVMTIVATHKRHKTILTV